MQPKPLASDAAYAPLATLPLAPLTTASLPTAEAGRQRVQRLLALAKQVEASRLAQALAGREAARRQAEKEAARPAAG